MTIPLAPIVHGPILTSSRQVVVSGALQGASVELLAGGAAVGVETAPANGDLWVRLDRRLDDGELVAARQSLGGQTSQASNKPVEVLPVPEPLPVPVFASPVSKCMNRVLLAGLVPGAVLELQADATMIASTKVRAVAEWIGFDPSLVIGASVIRAVQRLDGLVSPTQTSDTLRFPPQRENLQPPLINNRLTACDTAALVSRLIPAGEMELIQSDGTTQVWTNIAETYWATGIAPLRPGPLRAMQRLPGCGGESVATEVEVGPAEKPGKPEVKPFCPELRRVHVSALKPRALLTLWKREWDGAVETEIGSFGVGKTAEDIDLPDVIGGSGPIMAIVARQTACGLTSDPGSGLEFARPGPGLLPPARPGITPPLVDCSRGIQATNLLAGAQPFSRRTGKPLGDYVALPAPTAILRTWLPLTAGDEVEIRQEGCGAPSPSEPERVRALPVPLPVPRIVEPVRPNARTVTIENFIPGSRIHFLVEHVERAAREAWGKSIAVSFAPPLAEGERLWAVQTLCTEESTREGSFVIVRKGSLKVTVAPQSVTGGTAVALTVTATDTDTGASVPGLAVVLGGTQVGSTGVPFSWSAPGSAGSVSGLVLGGPAYNNALFGVTVTEPQPQVVAVTLNLFPGPVVVPNSVWQEDVAWTLMPSWGAAPVTLNANTGVVNVPEPPAGGTVGVFLSLTAHLQGDIGGIDWPHDTISLSGPIGNLALVNPSHAVSALFQHGVSDEPVTDDDGFVTGWETKTYAKVVLFSIT
jgi:hypothetical protein